MFIGDANGVNRRHAVNPLYPCASDAIEWAHMILDRYEGRGAPPTMLTVQP